MTEARDKLRVVFGVLLHQPDERDLFKRLVHLGQDQTVGTLRLVCRDARQDVDAHTPRLHVALSSHHLADGHAHVQGREELAAQLGRVLAGYHLRLTGGRDVVLDAARMLYHEDATMQAFVAAYVGVEGIPQRLAQLHSCTLAPAMRYVGAASSGMAATSAAPRSDPAAEDAAAVLHSLCSMRVSVRAG